MDFDGARGSDLAQDATSVELGVTDVERERAGPDGERAVERVDERVDRRPRGGATVDGRMIDARAPERQDDAGGGARVGFARDESAL